MKGSLQIAKVLGVRIYVHWTFAILIGWVMLSGKSAAESWWSIVFVLTIFVCVILHELGHAMAARYYGIKTDAITLLPIGGVATIEKIPEKPVQELVIALAGPMVNLIIAAILFLPVRHELSTSLRNAMVAINGENFIVNLFAVNLSLAAFNLLPAFPMDGGRVLRALLAFKLPRVKATRIAVYLAEALAVIFVVVGLSSNELVQTSPTLLLIALFVFFGAQAELQSVTFRSVLGGHHLSEVAMKKFGTLQFGQTLKDGVALLLDSPYHDFVVMKDHKVVGTLTRSELLHSLAAKGENATVGHCMNPYFSMMPAGASLEEGYDKMLHAPSKLLLVFDDGVLKGVVDSENVLEFVMTRQAVVR